MAPKKKARSKETKPTKEVRGEAKKHQLKETDLDIPNTEELLPDEIREILDNIPDEDTKRKLELIVCKKSFFAGPLPPPEYLKGYNEILKNGAERIMSMAEKQSAHRIRIEGFTIQEQLKQSGRGQIFGFILAIVLIGSAIFLALRGYETVASIIAGTTIVGLATVFVIGKKKE